MSLAEVMAPVRHVLLDFDGPVCSVFGELPAAEVARRLAASIDEALPDEVIGTDPLALLGVFAERDYATLVAAEVKLRELEVEAVLSAPITPGVVDALHAFHDVGRTVTIVSNNSAAAVRRFVDDHDLDELITDVSARERPEPDLLKPSPYLLRQAIARREATPSECVMIGDSVTDIFAAQAADTRVVGFANRPDKARTLAATCPPPDAVIRSLAELGAPDAGSPTSASSSPSPSGHDGGAGVAGPAGRTV